MAVMLQDGAVLLVDANVAVHQDCCCGCEGPENVTCVNTMTAHIEVSGRFGNGFASADFAFSRHHSITRQDATWDESGTFTSTLLPDSFYLVRWCDGTIGAFGVPFGITASMEGEVTCDPDPGSACSPPHPFGCYGEGRVNMDFQIAHPGNEVTIAASGFVNYACNREPFSDFFGDSEPAGQPCDTPGVYVFSGTNDVDGGSIDYTITITIEE